MSNITKEEQFEAVSGWWNSDKIVKWDSQYDNADSHTIRTLNRRLEKVLQIVDKLNLPKGSKVLEFGYGAGQTALQIGRRGNEIHGIDISDKLCALAKQRCEKEDPEGNYTFKTGNIEKRLNYEDNTFDLVVASGVLHYLFDPEACLKEAYRVLKPGGHLIIAQRSGYGLNDFATFRRFCCSMCYLILREPYELFPSFKSIFCESKLKALFGRWENSKFFNTKFMLKGHDVWTYKLKKRLYSNGSLKSLCRRSGFQPLKLLGAHYFISNDKKYHDFNLKVDDYFDNLAKKKFFGWIGRWARITVMLSQKREEGQN